MTYIVYWADEPGRTRAVTHICQVCKRFLRREYGLTLGYDSAIVSPNGRAHVPADHNEGYTACGHDATGPDWWWKSRRLLLLDRMIEVSITDGIPKEER